MTKQICPVTQIQVMRQLLYLLCTLIITLSDDVFGRCCGGGKSGGGCGGYVGGKPAPEHYKDGLFGIPRVAHWTRGQTAEVYWASRAGHRGGYAYRLCRVTDAKFWEVTEECFREGHLNFFGNAVDIEFIIV